MKDRVVAVVPTYGWCRLGDSWAKVQGNYFSSVLLAQGEMTGF